MLEVVFNGVKNSDQKHQRSLIQRLLLFEPHELIYQPLNYAATDAGADAEPDVDTVAY